MRLNDGSGSCPGFDAVHDQVQKHLLQLNAITRDRPVVHGQIGTQHDVVPG